MDIFSPSENIKTCSYLISKTYAIIIIFLKETVPHLSFLLKSYNACIILPQSFTKLILFFHTAFVSYLISALPISLSIIYIINFTVYNTIWLHHTLSNYKEPCSPLSNRKTFCHLGTLSFHIYFQA